LFQKVFQKEKFPSFENFERIALEALSKLHEWLFSDGTKKLHKSLYILRCPDVVHTSWMRKARRQLTYLLPFVMSLGMKCIA